MAFEIVKAGWMMRQSTILRRWKRNWFVLYQSGDLKYFETPDSHMAEESIRVAGNCVGIRTGAQVVGLDPPEGFGRSSLMTLVFQEKTLSVCAESADDRSAWQIALEQACSQPAPLPMQTAPPPYAAVTQVYPGQTVYYGAHPPSYVVQQQPGHTTVVYTDQPYYRRRRCDGTDVAMGVVAGAALGSMMWGPLLWW